MDSSQLNRFQTLTAGIRKDDRYSDMTITCHGTVFELHKAIVCTQSKPLAAAFSGNFMESKTSTIDLEDDDPEVVELMVRFLYEQTMDLTQKENDKLLLLVTKIYVIADKYDVQPLTHLASAKFAEILPTAYKAPSFAPSLYLLYSQSAPADRSLKDPAITTITTHIDELLGQQAFTNVCEEHASLAVEVLKATRVHHKKVPHTLRHNNNRAKLARFEGTQCAKCGWDMEKPPASWNITADLVCLPCDGQAWKEHLRQKRFLQ